MPICSANTVLSRIEENIDKARRISEREAVPLYPMRNTNTIKIQNNIILFSKVNKSPK